MLFGFEVVVFIAGVLAAIFGRGRFSIGPGMALANIAGTILVGSAFGYISAGRQLGTTSLTPLLAFRFLAGGVIAAAAAYCVLSRDPKSWRVAALGAAMGLPSVALAAAVMVTPARRAVMTFLSGGGIAQTGLAVVAVVVVGGLLCASVHLLIKAFEMGRVPDAWRVCPGCGYDWTGLSKCPECGREQNPGLAKA